MTDGSAPWTTWRSLPTSSTSTSSDSYAFVVVQENARASLAASYRRGSAYNVYLKDRSQHSEYSTQHMPVKVFCEAWVPTPFTVTAAGLFTQGDWATLKQMTDEGRECRVGFDSRVATPLYIEHEEAALSFEFERLHAPYPTWEALAQVRIQPGSLGALRTSYRRGHGSYIHQKSLVQHATVLNSPQTINVWCDSQRAPFKVLSVSAVGTATHGSFEAFHTPFTDSAEGYFCKVRVDGRTLHPLTQEYGGAASPMLFDDVALAGYHNQWDAYAGVSLTHASSALLVASYRRGHHDYVWLKDRDQYGLTVSTALPMTFLCE